MAVLLKVRSVLSCHLSPTCNWYPQLSLVYFNKCSSWSWGHGKGEVSGNMEETRKKDWMLRGRVLGLSRKNETQLPRQEQGSPAAIHLPFCFFSLHITNRPPTKRTTSSTRRAIGRRSLMSTGGELGLRGGGNVCMRLLNCACSCLLCKMFCLLDDRIIGIGWNWEAQNILS